MCWRLDWGFAPRWILGTVANPNFYRGQWCGVVDAFITASMATGHLKAYCVGCCGSLIVFGRGASPPSFSAWSIKAMKPRTRP